MSAFFFLPQSIIMFIVVVLQPATVKPPNIIANKKVLNFMRNPKLGHILVMMLSSLLLSYMNCPQAYVSGKQCSGVLKFENGTDEYMLNCDYTPGCDVKIVAHYTTILMLCEVQVNNPHVV